MLRIFCNAFILLTVVACGKKIAPSKNSNGNANDSKNPLSSSLMNFIQKQSVVCEDDKLCPESIAKIVVIDRDVIRYCTATLISDQMMVTSASCLPETLRAPGLDCSSNIFAIFPKTNTVDSNKVSCSKIVSSDSNANIDPALWKSDFTFFSLQSSVNRKASDISRLGLKNGQKYQTWKVHYENDTDSVIKSEKCMPVHDSYSNPFADSSTSPMMPIAGCYIQEGSGGAPLFNNKAELVGIFSEKLDSDVVFYISMSNLLSEPMLSMHFASNFSCAKLPTDELDYDLDKDCYKQISRVQLDKLRSSYLTSDKIHKENMNNILEELEINSKFFKWNMNFYQDFRNNKWHAHVVKPKCFFDIDTWIDDFTRIGGFIRSYIEVDFEFKQYEIKTKLNRFLRPVSVVEQDGMKKYKLTFNPKSAFNDKTTFLKVDSKLFGRDLHLSFDKVTNTCQ